MKRINERSFGIDLYSCGPLVRRRRNIGVHADNNNYYETSYNRSYYYENVIGLPFVHERVKRAIHEDRRLTDYGEPPEAHESVNSSSYVTKYPSDSCSADYYRRFRSAETLRNLHDEYVADPVRPLKIGPTTSALAHEVHEQPKVPKTWRQLSLAEEFTFSIPSHCKEGFSTCSPNESGYTKYLDPYVTTTQSTHCAFDRDQLNGVAKKGTIDSYFHREYSLPHRVHTKLTPSVPYFGRSSSYAANYRFVPTNLMFREENFHSPVIYKSTEDENYCTEQCHIGTGWPVRATLDIGTVPGTY